MNNNNNAETLKRARFDGLGITVEKAAKICGVDLKTYRRWERGETKPPIMAIRLFKIMAGDIGQIDSTVHGWAIGHYGLIYSDQVTRGFSPGDLHAAHWHRQLIHEHKIIKRREGHEIRPPAPPAQGNQVANIKTGGKCTFG